ncbi:MAG: DUF2236 domain-containing protein, partial [Hymenobacter sp.]|nr:DUF2236 domain-containing protein [Hymenobacter sp.]
LARLFSTVEYARKIVFAERAGAERAIDTIAAIHGAVEAQRGMAIPAWAYRDVLFLLIDYSIRAFEVLERPLKPPEKEEVFSTFRRLGERMGVPDLPGSYTEWLPVRQQHLAQNLEHSRYTTDLYRQYRRHLGGLRYGLLLQAQRLVVPPSVRALLKMDSRTWLPLVLPLYRRTQHLPLSKWAKAGLLPPAYKDRILALDNVPT